MKTLKSLLVLCTVAALFACSPLSAQQKRVSPHDTISTKINVSSKTDGSRVILIYGRPYTKDPKTSEPRTIWGGKLVPAGKIWRLGADEATLLITEKAIVLGGTAIPAGAHTLFLQYEENGSAKLVVSKQIGQWGLEYDAAQDLARIDLKKDAVEAPADQFTMALTKNKSGGGGTLTLMWGDIQYSATITIAN